MRILTEVAPEEFHDKTVILRSCLNIPLDARGEITDELRLRRALLSIRYLQQCDARIVVVAHIGRKPEETLRPIFTRLASLIKKCTFTDLRVGSPELQRLVRGMRAGEVLVLENIRRENRETDNDMSLAVDIAALGDFFVGDAFPDSHRGQPSVVGVAPLLPHCAGVALADEVANLSRACAPEHPSIAFVAGSKFETKEPLIKTLLQKYDEVFVGGALANDVLIARGFSVGSSVISDEQIPNTIRDNEKLLIPLDVVVERGKSVAIVSVAAVEKEDVIVDIGPLTILMLTPKILAAKFVVWNGPMGWYEKGYVEGSQSLAGAIAQSEGISVVGGGDTIATIEHPGFIPEDAFDFVSAGGGAMLEFLLEGKLPGVDVLKIPFKQ